MKYTQINKVHIDYFNNLLGRQNVISCEKRSEYSMDHTENLSYVPDLVLFPKSAKIISKILKFCNKHVIPVTASASLTGLSGGALPLHGGISLSFKKMNNIIEIDKENFQATVEPGVINEDFQNKLLDYKLFYPPDPASKGSCSLGGNFALNAGGPKAVKYGVTSNFVLNLEIVLSDGTIMWTGANTLKNSTGYNLTQIMIGSEGTLAVITKAVLRLLPLPTFKSLLVIPFKNNSEACQAVSKIMLYEIIPSALEFIEKRAVMLVKEKLDIDIPFTTDNEINSYLYVEIDGGNKKIIFEQIEKIFEIMQNFDCGESILAETSSEQNKLWKIRRSIGLAVKKHSIYKEEDTVVPRAYLVELYDGVKVIEKKYNFKTVCYGHAGDGNLHVNILKENLSDHEWNVVLNSAIKEIFQLCVKLKGTISGEHGIGLVQKQFINIALSRENINLQKKIKAIFDPKNILNPDKIFM